MLEQEEAVRIRQISRSIQVPEKTFGHAAEECGVFGTGDTTSPVRARLEPLNLKRPQPLQKDGDRHSVLPSPETRAAFRAAWNAARHAAEAMVQAATDGDLMAQANAADDLDQALTKLWNLRASRDLDWKTILNHVQGMMRQFFAQKRVEQLTVDQCKIILNLVDRYLGPATKTVDDLNEVLRLIKDAGFDPYAAISDGYMGSDQQVSP